MNKKSIKDRSQILRCLVEGNSIRSTVRLTGASKNTIAKLLVEVGEACLAFHDAHVSGLPCKQLQVDEIWSFVYSKQKNVPEFKQGQAGDIWTWTAICADTKLVASWLVGNRDAHTAEYFARDLAFRLNNRIQLTSDGLKLYVNAVQEAFGEEIDYAMLVKLYGETIEGQRRYSPTQFIGARKTVVSGEPVDTRISTSYAERQNLTMRMSMRRFTRLTNGFSKKIENHVHAISLHFMYYNFCRVHSTIKTTPAAAANLTDRVWSLEDIIQMTDAYWAKEKQQGKSN
jgi:IS1 family transposase